MGVQVRLVLYAPTEEAAKEAAEAAYHRAAALEDIMSDYRPTSELMRLCEQAGGEPVPVSPELFSVLQRAQHLADLTDGAFDITVGPYVKLWRIARKTGVLPSSEALGRAASLVGWKKVRLFPESRSVQLLVGGMQLDLGGIAKGFAADEMMRVLGEHSVHHAFIEIGGDYRASAAPPDRAGWRVMLENASTDRRYAVVADTAVSSSGDTMQFIEVDGVRYSHIVDPRTGLGLTSRIAVTVLAPDAFTSDGLATTLCILGADKGEAFLKRFFPGTSAYIRRADDSTVQSEGTSDPSGVTPRAY